MKIEEIGGFVNERFKNIERHFRKSIDEFESENILEFRSEIRKLKVFLHLISMASEYGLSYHISKRMKRMYGYLGIIQNFQLQLNAIVEYESKSSKSVPIRYMNILQKELKYWKELSKDFIDPDYDFLNDECEILAALPDQLTNKSKICFINYILHQIGEISGHKDEDGLNNVREFLEDIYYNLPFLKPFFTKQQSILFDEKEVGEYLKLFGIFHDKCTAVSLLQTFSMDALDEHEKQFIKQMENEWLHEKNEIREHLASRLNAMRITDNQSNKLSLQE
jgi:hypothetical protein